ncbi:MAG: helix-turn-helix domain-containing protein [Erysipelotrichaceae bacterium]|nr:helix-turn-helix domain-containing protein [Erysipelotrichaceae bacterium]
MGFAKNLRALRYANDLSQQDVADIFQYKSFTTIQKWEDGTSMPNPKKMKVLADYFHIPMESLLRDDFADEVTEVKQIPILGVVRTGPGIAADQVVLGYEYVSAKEAEGGEYFYLNVVGDSMKDVRILEGDVVYCRKQSTIENGELAVVLLENNEATLKRILFEGDKMILKPENSAYEPMVFTQEEIIEKNISILGKVIHNKIRF